MKWYVIQVSTGTEPETKNILEKDGIPALSPMENRLIRSGGRWRQKIYTLFPGYVFIQMDYKPEMYRRLLDTKNVIRILSCSGSPSFLTDQEALWIEYLGGRLLEPSILESDGSGGFRVLAGPLEALEDKIIKIDWHRRRALVSLTIAGHEVRPEFSLAAAK